MTTAEWDNRLKMFEPARAVDPPSPEWLRLAYKIVADLAAVEAERDSEHEACAAAVRQWNKCEAERDAYKKAKAENDERFMLERDEARAERDRLREELADLRAYYDSPITPLDDKRADAEFLMLIERIESRRTADGKAK